MDLLVDTGATISVVPSGKLLSIGVKPIDKIKITLADGRQVVRNVGVAFFELKGKRIVCPVAFGINKDDSVLGVTVLESLGYMFDFRTGKLRRKRVRF